MCCVWVILSQWPRLDEFMSSSTTERVALWVAARSGGVKVLRLLWSLCAAAMISDSRSKYRHDVERDFGRELPSISSPISARPRARACLHVCVVNTFRSVDGTRDFQLSITVVILPEHYSSRLSFVVWFTDVSEFLFCINSLFTLIFPALIKSLFILSRFLYYI